MQPSHIKPIPYHTAYVSHKERDLAAALRQDFVPKIKRRFPHHHLCGLDQRWFVRFISLHKAKYPFFLRADIRRFYPSIRHQDLLVGTQIAYRDLVGLSYVPKSFKKLYMAHLTEWVRSLPLEHRGIPISSPLSAILAPLMLLPLWFRLKRLWNVPLAIYMDDILILCEDKAQQADIYEWLHNNLHSEYDLELNSSKTESGRFAYNKLHFCGWEYVGGYARPSKEHTDRFLDRIRRCARQSKEMNPKRFIKRINRKIDGFGNYYKHGTVKGIYEELDVFIRSLVREHLYGDKRCGNAELKSLGLRSLSTIYARNATKTLKGSDTPKLSPLPAALTAKPKNTQPKRERASDGAAELGVISKKLTQLIALQRQQLRLLEYAITPLR